MSTISEIKEIINSASVESKLQVCKQFEDDKRAGVQKLVTSAKKQYDAYLDELERCDYMLSYEKELYDNGCEYIAGVDEVGRGPLAGPVVTCAVILPKDVKILYANDSKKLSEKKREELYDEIMEKAIDVQICAESVKKIDQFNILGATKRSMLKSIKHLKVKPDHVLIDAVTLDMDIPQTDIVKGDEKSMSIACASIVAKVYRDRMMKSFAEIYPEYSFESNKGYGTDEHIKAIKKHGLTPIHRRSFVKNIVE